MSWVSEIKVLIYAPDAARATDLAAEVAKAVEKRTTALLRNKTLCKGVLFERQERGARPHVPEPDYVRTSSKGPAVKGGGK